LKTYYENGMTLMRAWNATLSFTSYRYKMMRLLPITGN